MASSIVGLTRHSYARAVKLSPLRIRNKSAMPGSSLDRGLNWALGFRSQIQRFEYLRQSGVQLTDIEQKLVGARDRLRAMLYEGGTVKPAARMQVEVGIPEVDGEPILPEPIAGRIRDRAENYFGENEEFVNLALSCLARDLENAERILSELESAFQYAVEHGYSLRKLIPALYHYLNVTANPTPFSVIPSVIREAVDMGREPGDAILMAVRVIGGLSDEAETMLAWDRMEASFWNRAKKRIGEIFILERFFSVKYDRWFGMHNPFGSEQGKAADPYINTGALRRLLLNPKTRDAALQNIFEREICREVLDKNMLDVFGGRDIKALKGNLTLYKGILSGSFSIEIKERVVDKFIETIERFRCYPRMGEIATEMIRLVVENPSVAIDLKEKMLVGVIESFDYRRAHYHYRV